MGKEIFLIKKCHHCGYLMELETEVEKCSKCTQNFLPSNYFAKVHEQEKEYKTLFSSSAELHESELIKGLNVLW